MRSHCKKGKITPVAAGRAKVTAKANGKKAVCVVTVFHKEVRVADFQIISGLNGITLGNPYQDIYSTLNASNLAHTRCDYYGNKASQYMLKLEDVIKTRRGITLGMKRKDVTAAYGKTTVESFSRTTDKNYLVDIQSYDEPFFKSAKKVMRYTYDNDSNYMIHFYFDKKDVLIAIIFTKAYATITDYAGWVKY